MQQSSNTTTNAPAATPSGSQAAPAAAAAPAPTGARPVWRDLMVPFSIAIAGMFIGAGLYFGGPGSSPAAATTVGSDPAAENGQTAQNQANLENINPVTEEDYVKGNPDAPITIVEYSDYDCPFCARFHETMNDIMAERDDVAWVFRHFPLEQLHPQAPAVALAGECVGREGGNDSFWSFTDAYFAARGSGDNTPHNELIPTLAVEAGVSEADFLSCFENGETQAAVEEDFQNAAETGGRGTPWSILIGPNGETYPINGAVPKASVEQVINTALAEA